MKILYLSFLFSLFYYNCIAAPKNNKRGAGLIIYDSVPGCSVNKLPSPVSYINDFEKIFTSDQIFKIEQFIKNYEAVTSNQIAVVTIPFAMVDENCFEDFTLRLFKEWGIGEKKKNNGILIAISKYHKIIRIQNGYGIEKVFSDKQTKYIIDNDIIPYFKKGNYYAGVYSGLKAIARKIKRLDDN